MPSDNDQIPNQLLSPLERTLLHPGISEHNLSGKIVLDELLSADQSGNFARIYNGTHQSLGKVAVKVLHDRNPDSDDNLKRDIARELKVWCAFDHENILRLEGFYMHEGYPALVSIWMADGSLWGFIKDRRLGRMGALSMICGIAAGLSYMHGMGVRHSDVKSDNILISPERKPLLTDFGWSRMDNFSKGYSTASFASSTPWQAKELFSLDNPKPTKETDVWAFGMTVYELLANDRPYHATDPGSLPGWISDGNLPEKPAVREADRVCLEIEEYIWTLCCKCWEAEPMSRPSMSEIKTDVCDMKARFFSPVRSVTAEGDPTPLSEKQLVKNSVADVDKLTGATEPWKKLLHELAITDLTGKITLRRAGLEATDTQSTTVYSRPEDRDSKARMINHPTIPMFHARGGFGEIYCGNYISHGTSGERPIVVAVKRILDKRGDGMHVGKHLQNELRIWSQVSSKQSNILPLLGCAFFDEFGWGFPAMVSVWVADHSLRVMLAEYQRKSAFSVALGVAKGLCFLHSQKIIHGDLKSDNILINQEMKPLLIDFGMSSSDSIINENKGKGSQRWMAPELFPKYSEGKTTNDDPLDVPGPVLEREAGRPTEWSDTWAFGMTVYELLSRQLPYFERNFLILEQWIRIGQLPEKPICLSIASPESAYEVFFWDICSKCWRSRDARPNIESLVEEMLVFDHDQGSELTEVAPTKVGPRLSPVELLSDAVDSKLVPNLTDKLFLVSEVHRNNGASVVYKAQTSLNRFEVAVKRLPIDIVDEKTAQIFAAEVADWAKLKHENVMQISGYCFVGNGISLVTVWMEHGSLRDYMTELTNASECLQMVAGVVKGLAYIHSQGLVHSDVKSSNVLVSSDKRALLTDFGMARAFASFNAEASEMVLMTQSIRWHSYELFDQTRVVLNYTEKSDVWAFGMTVYEILTQKIPYHDISGDDEVRDSISHGILPSPPEYPDDIDISGLKIRNFMRDLCKKCWELDAEFRPFMATLEEEMDKFDRGDDNILVKVEGNSEVAEETRLPDTDRRLSSAGMLARILGSRPDLDLTGKVLIDSIVIGRGGFANVRVGTIMENNVEIKVAVKRLPLDIGGNEKIAKNVAREIRVWARFGHPNILPLLGYCIEGDYMSLIYTWMWFASELHGRIGQDGDSKDGIARGMEYIHSRNAIHSDLKSDNVLVSDDKQALLMYFGVSRMDALSAGFTTHSSPIKGSTRWLAMEFFAEDPDDATPPTHTTKTDIWAFGMTVYELLTHQLPYHEIENEGAVVLAISRGRRPNKPSFVDEPKAISIDTKINQYLWSICERCWADAGLRPSMEQLGTEIYKFSATLK